MAIRRVEVERFSVTSSKSFESVVAALKAGVGRLDMVEFTRVHESIPASCELRRAWKTASGGTWDGPG